MGVVVFFFAVLHYCCIFVMCEISQMFACVCPYAHTDALVCLVWLIIDLSVLSSIRVIVLVAARLCLCVSGCWALWKDFFFYQVDTYPKPKQRQILNNNWIVCFAQLPDWDDDVANVALTTWKSAMMTVVFSVQLFRGFFYGGHSCCLLH